MKSSEKLIQTIKQQQIDPLPRWRFRLKNTLLWGAFFLAVFSGALAFSVILFAIQQTDFKMINHLGHSRLELFLGLLPFFWIILLIIFLTIAIYSIQYSDRGYKFTGAKIVGFSVGLSILLGTFFFIAGGAHQLEHAFDVNLVMYEGVQEKRARIWTMPEEGYLCGYIEKIEATSFHLQDMEGSIWIINQEGAFIHGAVFLKKGERIKLIGEMIDSNQFKAVEIRPWNGPGGGEFKRGQNR